MPGIVLGSSETLTTVGAIADPSLSVNVPAGTYKIECSALWTQAAVGDGGLQVGLQVSPAVTSFSWTVDNDGASHASGETVSYINVIGARQVEISGVLTCSGNATVTLLRGRAQAAGNNSTLLFGTVLNVDPLSSSVVTLTGSSFVTGSGATGQPFLTAVDIANRALQLLGAKQIDLSLGFSEPSKNAFEIASCYNKLRMAELQRNTWAFAIRRTPLRVTGTATMQLQASLWSAATTYPIGCVVADQFGTLWHSRIPNNVGNDPLNSNAWEEYFGQLFVSQWVAPAAGTTGTAYYSGELVYTTPGDGTVKVYRSLIDSNADNPATATQWDATVTYSQNDVVTYLGTPYMSLVDFNLNQTPNVSPTKWTTTIIGSSGSVNWREIGGADFPLGVGLTPPHIIYPLGAGPFQQTANRNVYRLPAGWLRKAPQEPLAGTSSFLGSPTNLQMEDWEYDDVFIVSRETDPILYRFVSNVSDVRKMHPMFCEGLACRIALATCMTLTQSTEKVKLLEEMYNKFMSEARLIDAIISGPTYPPLDDYIATRL